MQQRWNDKTSERDQGVIKMEAKHHSYGNEVCLESNLYEHADRYFCVMSLDIDQNPSHSNEKRILRCTIRREVKPALI